MRTAVAVVASAVLPGLGQAVQRRWRAMTTFLVLAGAFVGTLAVVVPTERAALVRLLTAPGAVRGVLVADGVLFLLRWGACADVVAAARRRRRQVVAAEAAAAARAAAALREDVDVDDPFGWAAEGPPEAPDVVPARTPIARRAARRAVAIVGVAVLAAPHVVLGHYVARTDRVLRGVFEGPSAAALAAEAAPGGASASPGGAGQGPTAPPATATSAGPPSRPADGPPPVPVRLIAPWAEDGRLTVALLGSDAGPGRGGDRLDAMLVVSVEVATGSTVVLSVERYLLDYPMPEGLAELHAASCPDTPGWRYLNAAYRCFKEFAPGVADLYPDERDPAAAAVRDVLAELLALEVDHHVFVNMEGFVRGVDALGGVTVDLARPIDVELSPAIAGDPWIEVALPAGRQELDGREALAYVRNRKNTGGDKGRMQRQRCLIAAIAERAEPSVVLSRYGAVLGVVEEHAATSLPLSILPDLVDLLGRIDTQDIVTVGFGPPVYRGPDYAPDVVAIRQRVQELLTEPLAADDPTVERGTQACG